MSEQVEVAVAQSDALLRALAPLLDVPLQIAIEVGRVRLRVRDLVNLAPQGVIELKKAAGEPFDVSINGITVARGEIITVEQSSGLRILEIYKARGAS